MQKLEQHRHQKTRELIVLDSEGHATDDRLVVCQSCGMALGTKKPLPFPEPQGIYRDLLIPEKAQA